MHQKTPRPIKPQHLPRLFAWALLWLLKYAWLLAHDGEDAKSWLRRHGRLIANLVVIRAAHRFAKAAARKPLPPPSAPPGFVQRRCMNWNLQRRAMIGAHLRRRLNPRCNGVRLTALFNALFDLDALTDHVAKRMVRRLTRLSPIVPVRPPARALASPAPAPAPLSADTS
jgi:hypothetical protein